MTAAEPAPRTAELRMFRVREAARREAFRIARDSGAAIVTRPELRTRPEPAVKDVEPLAGARAARDLQAAAHNTARDYIRQAREAGHGWEQIGRALGVADGTRQSEEGITPAEAAYTFAAGPPEAAAPWQPRSFTWTCRSCNRYVADRGLIAGPADDELGHAEGCSRLAAAVAEWDAGWEAEP